MTALLCGLAQPAEAAKKHKKHKKKAPSSLTYLGVADPSVVKAKSGFVIVGTGTNVSRAVAGNGLNFRAADPALARKPAWARTGAMWAADVQKVGKHWLLYFAAPVAGLKSSSRCIGVAVASSPTGTFTPLDDRPLVCPAGAAVPAAEDRPTDLPSSHGDIDPSFVIMGGRPYLAYKTDGIPSSIRLLPLTADGAHAAGPSYEILRSAGVVENPVIFHHGKVWFLLTSEGSYTSCDYRTVWRRTLTPLASWQGATAHVMLNFHKQRICGPGGADVVTSKGKTLVYFHGWTCNGTRRPCAPPLSATSSADAGRRPVRTLYGMRLGFTKKGFPTFISWLKLPGKKK
ncbi:MAG: family 43 glycosylhydrolase [Nocardioides sp.]|uniref:family 43 glycosylhydrolase n=1 Tax=Nocardioides sp. TaxID=35761 RepID=UPI0039E63E1D